MILDYFLQFIFCTFLLIIGTLCCMFLFILGGAGDRDH